MGTVVTFPESRRSREAYAIGTQNASATIIILPVIRIERYSDEPDDYSTGPTLPGRKRRRRATRS